MAKIKYIVPQCRKDKICNLQLEIISNCCDHLVYNKNVLTFWMKTCAVKITLTCYQTKSDNLIMYKFKNMLPEYILPILYNALVFLI